MPSLADYERDRAETQEQLDLISSQIRDDPDNTALYELQSELGDLLSALDEEISQLKPQSTSAAAPEPAPAAPPEKSKAGFKKVAGPPEDEVLESYQVNDNVMAKYAGDKAWYPAKITSITGSSTAPIYTVKFKGYEGSETIRSRDIRPVSNKKKPDSGNNAATPNSAASAAPTPPSAPGVVSSATATVYPGAKRDAEDLDENGEPKPKKAKKIKAKKELEANKNKWNAFQQSKHGKPRKDSMFRTPEGVHGRVGFTGSGQAMRADATRSRHIYQVDNEAD